MISTPVPHIVLTGQDGTVFSDGRWVDGRNHLVRQGIDLRKCIPGGCYSIERAVAEVSIWGSFVCVMPASPVGAMESGQPSPVCALPDMTPPHILKKRTKKVQIQVDNGYWDA